MRKVLIEVLGIFERSPYKRFERGLKSIEKGSWQSFERSLKKSIERDLRKSLEKI